MGAQWKQAGRVANANKKGQIIGKLTKEIAVAAKLGGPNPDSNFRLRGALEAARKASVTRRHDRARYQERLGTGRRCHDLRAHHL